MKWRNTTTQLLEWLKSKKLTIPTADEDAKNRNLYSLLVEVHNDTATPGDSWQCLTKLNIVLLYGTAIVHLGIFLNETKTNRYTKSAYEGL